MINHKWDISQANNTYIITMYNNKTSYSYPSERKLCFLNASYETGTVLGVKQKVKKGESSFIIKCRLLWMTTTHEGHVRRKPSSEEGSERESGRGVC